MAEQRYMSINDAQKRYSLCRNTLVKLAKQANALYKIGRAVRIDSQGLDNYIADKLAVKE